jgi:type I restriction enzyme S subunit
VYWWLYSLYRKNQSSGLGTAYPALNGKKVKQIEIPLPNSDIQSEIVHQLNHLDKRVRNLSSIQQQTQVELEALLPSILDKAFRGEW